MVNIIKDWEESVAAFFKQARESKCYPEVVADPELMKTARDFLMMGFMLFNRAITKPKDVWND